MANKFVWIVVYQLTQTNERVFTTKKKALKYLNDKRITYNDDTFYTKDKSNFRDDVAEADYYTIDKEYLQ
jgi:hypothetical protein